MGTLFKNGNVEATGLQNGKQEKNGNGALTGIHTGSHNGTNGSHNGSYNGTNGTQTESPNRTHNGAHKGSEKERSTCIVHHDEDPSCYSCWPICDHRKVRHVHIIINDR